MAKVGESRPMLRMLHMRVMRWMVPAARQVVMPRASLLVLTLTVMEVVLWRLTQEEGAVYEA